jgi:phosphoglycerate dehydrogenase-like enzyme
MSQPTRARPAATKILVCGQHSFAPWNPPVELAESIRSRWPEIKAMHLVGSDRLDQEIADTDILVAHILRPEQLAVAHKLKWIHSFAAGVTQLMFPEVRRSGIEVTNASSVHCVPIAQHILGAIIALARRFPDCFRHQQQGRWAQRELWSAPVRPRELRGQVVLFVGFGAIGRETARLVRPLEMRIWAATRTGCADSELAEKSFSSAKLHEALPEADYIVVAAPETPETRGMIGAAELAMMKPSAYFVNVARGAIVDEPALISALQRQAIAGAALDVTAREPLPPESPLWQLDNVLITPHVSGLSDRTWARQQELLIENLERWFSGRGLLNRVDLQRGY